MTFGVSLPISAEIVKNGPPAPLHCKTTLSAGFLSVTVRPVTSVISIGLLFCAVSFFVSLGPPHAAMSILTIRRKTVAK